MNICKVGHFVITRTGHAGTIDPMGLSKVATPLLLLLLAGLAAGHRPMQDLVGSSLNNPQCDACIVVGRILSDYLW